MKLFLDFETRSEVDLKKVGAWKYATHPSTEIMCVAWAYDNGGKKISYLTHANLEARDTKLVGTSPDFTFVAHNAQFEYAIYNCILHRRYGWPALWDPARWSCTMARALMVGLPPALEDVGRALNLPIQKDLEGRAIMQRLCKPIDYDALGDPIFDNDPAKFERLYAYNKRDVETEMLVDAALPELPVFERRIWELDLLINRRGVQIDLDLCREASKTAAYLTDDLNGRLKTLTKGAVDKATRVAAMSRYLESHGTTVVSLDKTTVTDLLDNPKIGQHIKDVVSIRRQVGKSSTAKYAKAIEAAGPDGRVRGALQYHAAHTGRWGGRLIQPQNYPKGFGEAEQKIAVEALKSEDPLMFALAYGDKAMDALSNTLRGTIIAASNKKLICADYNAIEARVLFWLANDQSALDIYRRGESPYVDMANYIYGRKDITKKGNPKEYDLGKRAILGCGYGMGAEKFKDTVKIQANYEIPLELADRAVKAYREKYFTVKRAWYEVENAAIEAVKTPGKVQKCCDGKLTWGMSNDRRFLVCRLPSGRYLWYFKPSVRLGKTPWGEEKEEMCFMGENPKTREWCALKTYGGALVENVVQAIARDIMANGMFEVENAGFEIILTVHDELIAEVPADSAVEDDDMVDLFTRRMCALPPWAQGCPISAEGWTGERYRK